ncbi:MAG: hypothetical protein FJX77_11480, partial [Armatimonadetes bacterium]|nr:hypothetical protein [Armatimonadota bacterium]
TDAGVEALLGLTQLRELDLSLLPITDAGVARLAGLPALRDLRLLYAEGFAGPRVTEPGLAALGRFPSLRSLDLTGARIGDAATREIAAARQLQVLRLARTGVTEAGVRALREALPGCRITR